MAWSVLGLLLVLHSFLPRVSLLAPPAGRLWARTRESFRLSEVLLLEARLQLGPYMQTMAVDPQGSCLISFPEITSLDYSAKGTTRSDLPSSLARCDWVAEEIATAPSPETFLYAAGQSALASPGSQEAWSLEYTCFAPVANSGLDMDSGSSDSASALKGFNSRGLSLRLAQLLSAPAALHPSEAHCKLVLLETATALTLLRVLFPAPSGAATSNALQEARFEAGGIHKSNAGADVPSRGDANPSWWKAWAARPFQYSSACNPALADILMDLVASLEEQNYGGTFGLTARASSNNSTSKSLLDLTCGSGTLLACATRRGFVARGLDVNPRCVDGANENLAHQGISRDAAQAICGDATRPQALVALAETLRRTSNTDSNVREKTGSESSSEANNGAVPDGAATDRLELEESPLRQFDCMVANLPWGRHSVAYAGGNAAFLDALLGALMLRPGAPCVFVVGAGDGEALIEDLEARGFELCMGIDDGGGIGSSGSSKFSICPACVPPRNLNLPSSKKARRRTQRQDFTQEDADDESVGQCTARTPSRSDCEIVVARAPTVYL